MKLTGFLLLQLSAFLFASQRVKSGYGRAAVLSSFCSMLEQLRGLLETEPSPMPELLQTLSRRCDGAAAAFVNDLDSSMDALGEKSFQELWRKALRRSLISADAYALRELDALGAVLGRYALPAQLDSAVSCMEVLRSHSERTLRELPRISRLTWGLSLSVSMLFGIILL